MYLVRRLWTPPTKNQAGADGKDAPYPRKHRAMGAFYFLLLLVGSQKALSFSPTQAVSCTIIQKNDNRCTTTTLYGVRSAVRRVRDSVLSRERTDEDLKDGIAFFYDRSSKLWEDVWGGELIFPIDITHNISQ